MGRGGGEDAVLVIMVGRGWILGMVTGAVILVGAIVVVPLLVVHRLAVDFPVVHFLVDHLLAGHSLVVHLLVDHLLVALHLGDIPIEILLVAESLRLVALLVVVQAPLPCVLPPGVVPPDHCALHPHARGILYPSFSPLLPLHPPPPFDSCPRSAIAGFPPQHRKCGDFGTATKNPRPPSSYYPAGNEQG